MRCNPSARWGPGTTKEREKDTELAKELKAKMEDMMKEREKQNTMWTSCSDEKSKNKVDDTKKEISKS